MASEGEADGDWKPIPVHLKAARRTGISDDDESWMLTYEHEGADVRVRAVHTSEGDVNVACDKVASVDPPYDALKRHATGFIRSNRDGFGDDEVAPREVWSTAPGEPTPELADEALYETLRRLFPPVEVTIGLKPAFDDEDFEDDPVAESFEGVVRGTKHSINRTNRVVVDGDTDAFGDYHFFEVRLVVEPGGGAVLNSATAYHIQDNGDRVNKTLGAIESIQVGDRVPREEVVNDVE